MLAPAIHFPEVVVAETEFRRLLGYPRAATPSARAEELSRWARAWYGEHGRPWMFVRTIPISVTENQLAIDGVAFASPQLRQHLLAAAATEAVLFAVSAGSRCEEQARTLWQDGKPDEYFFLETYGSAVVERLTALVNAQVCADAEARGLHAIPHYSPGYGQWDVAEQPALFAHLRHNIVEPFPEPLDVLSSGMLRPKKSLLGVIGLSATAAGQATRGVPCERCSFSPCAYRRVAYRHADAKSAAESAVNSTAVNGVTPEAPAIARDAKYSIAPRALEKWARERLQLQTLADGSVTAVFRFDGTTCSNMGRPLAFEYRIQLGNSTTRYRIEHAECSPVAGDDGYQAMCEYLRDAEGLMHTIATEKPLLGRPLDEVLTWRRDHVSTGCYCDAASRNHKWAMAFEVLHYALAHAADTGSASASASQPYRDVRTRPNPEGARGPTKNAAATFAGGPLS
jgi:hypothetical protein